MTTELWLLFLSLPVYGFYLGAQSLIFRKDYGVEYAATPILSLAAGVLLFWLARKTIREEIVS